MGNKIFSVDFWLGFEKQAGFVGELAARAAGRGAAVNRMQAIRKVAPAALKPANLLGQIIQSPSKGLANAAARRSATWHSPKEKMLRAAGYGTMAAGGAAYAINKGEQDQDYHRLKAIGQGQG